VPCLLPIFVFSLFTLPLLAQRPCGVIAQSNAKEYMLRADTGALFVADSLTGKARKKLERLQVKKRKTEAKLARLNPQRAAALLQSQAKHKLDSLTSLSNQNASLAVRSFDLIKYLTVNPSGRKS